MGAANEVGYALSYYPSSAEPFRESTNQLPLKQDTLIPLT